VRRWPVAVLAAFVIALTAVTATYYIRPVSLALPAVVSEGGTYDIPANTVHFAGATGSSITVTANATVYTYFTSIGFGFAAVVPRLPPNASVCLDAGWCLANVTTPSGVYYALVHVVTDSDYNEYATCFKGVATRLDSGLYLITPSGWGSPAAWQIGVCDVAAAAGSYRRADFIFTGTLTREGDYIYAEVANRTLATQALSIYTRRYKVDSTYKLMIGNKVVEATWHTMGGGTVPVKAALWIVFAFVPAAPARVTVSAEPA